MIDRIDNTNINPLVQRDVQELQSEKVDATGSSTRNSAGTESSALGPNDLALISDEARTKLAQEREVLKFSRLALQEPEAFDGGKVAYFQAMLDNGRINEYLRTVNTDSLVDAILSGPTAAALR